MDKHELLLNDEVVNSLRREIQEGVSGISHVPEHVSMLIERDMWQERFVKQTGKVERFERFEDFVTTLPLEGLGTDLRTLKNLCRDDPEALTAIDRVTVGEPGSKPGATNNSEGKNQYTEEIEGGEREVIDDNIINNLPLEEPVRPAPQLVAESKNTRTSPTGTSRQKALRKLRKESEKEKANGDPGKVSELYERVLDTEDPMTPNKAMIEAGFRKKTITVPVDCEAAAARSLIKHFDPDVLIEAIRAAAGSVG